MDELPICDYEGSDYQTSFWERGGRAYEDAVEAVALRRLLPPAGGNLLLELGAGAGRNTLRYRNYQRVVLLDYSHTQLEQAHRRPVLTNSARPAASAALRLLLLLRLHTRAHPDPKTRSGNQSLHSCKWESDQ